jgi:hypothetical protein
LNNSSQLHVGIWVTEKHLGQWPTPSGHLYVSQDHTHLKVADDFANCTCKNNTKIRSEINDNWSANSDLTQKKVLYLAYWSNDSGREAKYKSMLHKCKRILVLLFKNQAHKKMHNINLCSNEHWLKTLLLVKYTNQLFTGHLCLPHIKYNCVHFLLVHVEKHLLAELLSSCHLLVLHHLKC